MAEPLDVSFAMLLKRERIGARMTQEELAHEAGLSERAVSDLERGLVKKPRKETVSLLAGALNLRGPARAKFEAAAWGHASLGGSVVSMAGDQDANAAERFKGAPQAWFIRVVAALDEPGVAAARSVVTEWRDCATMDDAWLTWVQELIRLTEEGKLPPGGHRPTPTAGADPFHGRDIEVAKLEDFLDRVRQGRGGIALAL